MNRDFKGVWIPAFIWLDTGLTAIEKVLLAEVDSFTSRDQEYYKSNETIATELGCSVSSVKRAVTKLADMGYVKRVAFDGRRRSLRSNIDPAARSESTGSKLKWSGQPAQNEPAGRSKRTKSNTKKATKKESIKEVALPWGGFGETWQAWREYKRAEHGFNFKSSKSEQAAIHNLQRISNDNAETAQAIIEQSIVNGWKGLFPLKGNPATRSAPSAADRDKFAAYIRTGSIDDNPSGGME